MMSLFSELALVMVIVFIISLAINGLKQPLIIGYILTGLLAGPLFLNVLSDPLHYEVFANIGVALLLFIVGLHLNLKLIKEVGMISIVTGLGQILFTTLFGFIINHFLGYSFIESLLIAIALTFSSTIIIVKLLSDSHALEKLHGKIALGFLLVQDFVAVFILIAVGTFTKASTGSGEFFSIILTGLGAVALVILLSKYLLSSLLAKVTKNKELSFLFIIAWSFGLAGFFEIIGFSMEIGSLLAGITLASTRFQHDISSRVKPLQDFFLVMFFIFLGTQLIPHAADGSTMMGSEAFALIASIAPEALLLSLFVLIGNPLIVFILIARLKYSSKTAFLSGLTVSQISEFSLIIILLAIQVDILGQEILSLVTLIAIITILASTYLIVYGEKLFTKLSSFLKMFEAKSVKDALQGVQGEKHAIGLFGFHRMGPDVLKAIKKMKESFIVVEHNPRMVHKLRSKGINVVFGDASNVEFISEFDFSHMRLLISTIPDIETSYVLLENYKAKNKHGIIVLTANNLEEAQELYELGANYVILPHYIGGHYVENLLNEYKKDEKRFTIEKIKHLNDIRHKKEYA